MKNYNKGFAVPVLLAIIALLLAGGGVYVYKNEVLDKGLEKSAKSNLNATSTGSLSVNSVNSKASSKTAAEVNNIKSNTSGDGSANPIPVITSILPSSGPIGTIVEIKGSNLAGFESDLDAYIKDNKGMIGFLPGIASAPRNFSTIKVKIENKVCTVNTGYSGLPCPSYMTIVPGTYKIYTLPWGHKSNEVTFTVTSQSQSKNEILINTAKNVLLALAEKNYNQLETLTSSSGLSFSTAPQLDLTKIPVTKESVSEIPKDKKIILWGYTDGKGDPINLTTAEFISKWIYTTDYLSAPQTAVNTKLGGGNYSFSLPKDIGQRDFVAFHFPGSSNGFDWTTIYLVFDKSGNDYKLRAIAKDNWSI